MHGYTLEASGPVPFEAELLLQTRIHPLNSSSPRPALFCKALKTTGQMTKALVADLQFSSRKLREQLSAHGVRAVIPTSANQSKGKAKLLRMNRYLRTHGPVVEKQIYTQDLNDIDQLLQNLFRLRFAPPPNTSAQSWATDVCGRRVLCAS